MQSEMPFFESAEQALLAAVQHLGGAKVVGVRLWGSKTPEAARTRLLDCLNEHRPERLDLGECISILSWAKEAGLHAPFVWVAGEVGYEARPITDDEQIDRVTLVVEQSAKVLAVAVASLERMQRVRVARG